MRTVLTYGVFFIQGLVFAQKATVTVQPSKIEVGVTTELKIKMNLPPSASFKYKPFDAVIPSRTKENSQVLTGEQSNAIEVVGGFKDTVYMKGSQKIWEGSYAITAWDEGVYDLEAGNFFLDDSTMVLPTTSLTVSLVKEKEGQDIYDIDEHFADVPPLGNAIVRFLMDYYWAFLILLALILLYWRWKVVNRKPEAPAKLISLKERSMLAVDALEKERLWEKGRLKEHYIELSYILRSYLSARYDLNLLEKTTPETKWLLAKVGLHPETIDSVEIVLMQSDLVKFAKSHPEEIEILKIAQRVRMLITETSPLEYENAE